MCLRVVGTPLQKVLCLPVGEANLAALNVMSYEVRGTLDRSPAWNGTAASLAVIYRF